MRILKAFRLPPGITAYVIAGIPFCFGCAVVDPAWVRVGTVDQSHAEVSFPVDIDSSPSLYLHHYSTRHTDRCIEVRVFAAPRLNGSAAYRDRFRYVTVGLGPHDSRVELVGDQADERKVVWKEQSVP